MATKVPAYTYSGTSSAEVKNGYWYIYLKSSGTLTFSYAKSAQVCLVGGGGSGGDDIGGNGGYGGGGGQVIIQSVSLESGRGYGVSIGAGGGIGKNGGATAGFGITAGGGAASGGGEPMLSSNNYIAQAGADGTYPFGDSSMRRYGACGGGGGAGSGGAGGQDGGGRGATNYGAGATNGEDGMGAGGGGGAYHQAAGSGGSGIVILRGTEDDLRPVRFNGVQLSKITFNGQAVTGLIYGGQRIFMRAARRLWACLFRRAAYGA